VLGLPALEPVLVHLKVGVGGTHQRRGDAEAFGAAQHVAEDRVGLGAAAGVKAAVNIAAQ
jgi:hypothetical protein